VDILAKTFAHPMITKEVVEEYGALPDWLNIETTTDRQKDWELPAYLGAGEVSCIELASVVDNPLLVIDDRRARKVAEERGIECVGSLGVLLLAKREGVIDSVKSILGLIMQTNFHVSDKILTHTLRLAKEL
jgi:predicted nucleic acid-binding protein